MINFKTFQKTKIETGKDFEDAVFELLLKCCSDENERKGLTLSNKNEYFDVFVSNGIRRLELPKGAKIEIKRVVNPSNFKRAFVRNRLKSYSDLVFIIDIDKTGLDAFLQSYGIKYSRLISYSELLLAANKHNNKIDYKELLSKCIQYENLADYLTFCIRMKIVASINIGHIISSTEINGQHNKFEYFDNNLTPFVYTDTINDKKYLFIKDYRETKRLDIKNSLDNFDSIIRISIAQNSTESETFRLIYQINGFSNYLDISKINKSDLSRMLSLYNEYLGYGRGEDFSIYKYRTFQRVPNRNTPSNRRYKTRKEAINFINKNTIDSVLNGTMWFSNKEQINDPFDLDTREPSHINVTTIGKIVIDGYKEEKSQYAILCTSRANDNILLWSHYADSHKGICSQYSKNDLLDAIDKDANISICIYGGIEYLSSRPDFSPIYSLLPYVLFDLFVELFNIRCLFSKYISWSYENEMRFAVIPKDKDAFQNGYGGIKLIPTINYYGQRLDFTKYGVYFRASHLNPVNTFELSNDEYLLMPIKKIV